MYSPRPSLSPGTSHNAPYLPTGSQPINRYPGGLHLGPDYATSRANALTSMTQPPQPLPYSSSYAPSRHMVHSAFNPSMQSFASLPPVSGTEQRPSTAGGQEGPPFGSTRVIHHIFSPRQQMMTPCIEAKIQKGFFQVDNKWTCYRRNYFTVTCGFQIKPTIYDDQLYLRMHPAGQLQRISQFSVQISAKTAPATNQESESRALVQYTPKRDKATESTPKKVVVQPAQVSILQPPNHFHPNMGLYTSQPTSLGGIGSDFGGQSFGTANHVPNPPQSHTFERIQFQKATANNGKRRAQQQYFHIVVDLFANVGGGPGTDPWIQIATAESQPMVVRGRSPGHYKDNRRDSSASMDPDRGGGAGGDGSGGPQPPLSMFSSNHNRSSNMDWESSQRGSTQMGGAFRHQMGRNWASTATLTPESSQSSGHDGGYGMGYTQMKTPSDDGSSIFEAEMYDEDDEGSSKFFRPPPTPVTLTSTQKRESPLRRGACAEDIANCDYKNSDAGDYCNLHKSAHPQPVCPLSYA